MAVSGLLAQYLSVKNELAYCQLQLTRYNDLQTAASKKLSNQENYQSKWEDSSMALYDSWSQSKEFKAGGQIFQYADGRPGPGFIGKQEEAASSYACKKVPKFDEEKLDEYTELDMDYSTMVSTYDTLCTQLETQAEALKEQIGTEAQDTHMLGG